MCMHTCTHTLTHTHILCPPNPTPHPARYTGMTGLKQIGALRFANELTQRDIPFWVRYVLIPGHTDSPKDIEMLCNWARKLPTLEGIELLPYHLVSV